MLPWRLYRRLPEKVIPTKIAPFDFAQGAILVGGAEPASLLFVGYFLEITFDLSNRKQSG